MPSRGEDRCVSLGSTAVPLRWDLQRRWSKKQCRPFAMAVVTSMRSGSVRRASARASSAEIEVWNELWRSPKRTVRQFQPPSVN
jgi:hypothetical protein